MNKIQHLLPLALNAGALIGLGFFVYWGSLWAMHGQR
jgi:hypothetical protein